MDLFRLWDNVGFFCYLRKQFNEEFGDTLLRREECGPLKFFPKWLGQIWVHT